ncbi:MAG: hypothetical protein IK095_09120 [Oscillospiraceae bacterium]|nr:hypothetical protein [Oscillospiraceae bacterium]
MTISPSIPMARKMKYTTPSTTGMTVVQKARRPKNTVQRMKSRPLKAGSATWVTR